jgi:hypothetical protein
MTGEIHSVALPEGRRRPVDHLSPAGVTAALAEVRRAFGDDAPLMAVVVDRDGPEVVVVDPKAPGNHTIFAPRNGEWIRVRSTGQAYGFAGSFRAGELGALTEDRMRLYRGRTLSRMARPGGDVFRVTIQRREAAGERSVLTTEIRSGTPRGDEAGWIVFGPKDEELEVVRP